MSLSCLLSKFKISTKQIVPKTMALFLCLFPSVTPFASDLQNNQPTNMGGNKSSIEKNIENTFKDKTYKVIDLLTKIPEEDQTRVLKYLKESWGLYEDPSELIEEIKKKYNLILPVENLDSISPPNIETNITTEEAHKFIRKIANLGTLEGTLKADLEGVVYCIAAIGYELDGASNDGLAKEAIDFLNRLADFLIETTDTAKAMEEALTKHQLLEGRRNAQLVEKIRNYDPLAERTTFYDQSRNAVSIKFIRRLRELGFGRLSLDLDTNASSPSLDEVSLTILETDFLGYNFKIYIFGMYNEEKGFRYQTGNFFKSNLTPLEE